MKERPILFSGPMVRALLAGTKTQTRRVVKPQPELTGRGGFHWKGHLYGLGSDHAGTVRNFVKWACPYGQPGDRMWVKETFMAVPRVSAAGHVIAPRVYYRATDEAQTEGLFHPWKPSIHMFRKYSRITLEVTGVRVERLQDISEADAKAEGIESSFGQWKNYTDQTVVCQKPVASYRTLWESINGPGSWDANPWVWVVDFKVF